MGLLAKLFGRSSKNELSYVRAWAAKREQELRYSKGLSPEDLFAAIMLFLLPFGESRQRGTIPSKWRGAGFEESKHYSGDGALFELGCYMYFRLDLWLYQHKPNRREHISRTFADGFVKLFSDALGDGTIGQLFDQRVSHYAELGRVGAHGEKYHYYLSQLILRTKDNNLPGPYNFGNEPVLIVDLFEELSVKKALAGWEYGMLPALIETVERLARL